MLKKISIIFIVIISLIVIVLGQVNIVVDTDSTKPEVSRNLFGKFTEHLGNNVYQGAWSQILLNPEFVPFSRWPDGNVLRDRLNGYQNTFDIYVAHSLVNDSIAPYWAVDDGILESELYKKDENDLQRVKTGEKQGIMRIGIYPPFHRTNKLDLIIKAKANDSKNIRVDIATMAGEVVTYANIDLNSSFQKITQKMDANLNSQSEQGESYILSLRIPKNSTIDLSRILLFPSDNIEGWEPEVVEYLKESKLPLLRFPGGNFVSGYHWKDGIGSLDERPVLPNPAWPEIEWNHVGTDEWLTLCELVGAEPLICVNAGNGTAEEAADWLEYCNGHSRYTTYGAERAANGHTEPYDVEYWEIGNELWGSWQVGHCDAQTYSSRYSKFYNKMYETDSNIKFIANGHDTHWNNIQAENNQTILRSLAIHTLTGGGIPSNANADVVYHELMAFADQYDDFIYDRVAEPMINNQIEPKTAITELQIFTNRSSLPNNWSHSEALWYSGIINSSIRSGFVELITHSALMNHGGGLRKINGYIYANPVWWTTHLYSTQPGTIPVDISVDSPTFSTNGKWITGANNIPYVDVIGLINNDKSELNLFITNRHPDKTYDAHIDLTNFTPSAKVDVYTLNANSYMDQNSIYNPNNVKIDTSLLYLDDNKIDIGISNASLMRLTIHKEGTSIEYNDKQLNNNFKLHNYPNPFNSSTEIEFIINEHGEVQIDVYNLQGHLIKSLIEDNLSAGLHRTTWDGTNKNGEDLGSGIFICRLMTQEKVKVRKLIMLK